MYIASTLDLQIDDNNVLK